MIVDYVRAQSVSEAIKFLGESRIPTRIIAGGTDILPKVRPVRHLESYPLALVDIKRIDALKGVREQDGALVIGPVTTLSEVASSKLVRDLAPALARAAGQVGSPEIRNRGTVGGNIGSKNAGADLLAPLIGMKASVEVCDKAGTRDAPLGELMARMRVGLGRRLVINAIKVPVAPATAWGYRRFSRESMGRPYASAVIGLDMLENGEKCRATTVLGGAGMWPRMLESVMLAEDLRRPGASMFFAFKTAEEMLSVSNKQIDDYRLAVTKAILSEAFEEAIAQEKR